jgi:glycosyltransferase involved in cell wall biosynthesis
MGSTVSIVIPCFNLGRFVREAVESAQSQSRPAEEIFVIDDGSTDPYTNEVLAELESEGVTVLRKANGGAPAARNYGIARATGDFILCLDADDVLLPHYLEETVPVLEASPELGIVGTHLEFFGNRTGTWQPKPVPIATMLWRNSIPSASLFRRQCWAETGGYRESLVANQDWDFWLSIIERGWGWTIVDRVLYRYRIRRGSISDERETLRPELMKELVMHHLALYQENVADVLSETEAELGLLKARVRQLSQTPRSERLRRDIERERRASALIDATLPEGAHYATVALSILGATPDDATLSVLQFIHRPREERVAPHRSAMVQSGRAHRHLENNLGDVEFLALEMGIVDWSLTAPRLWRQLQQSYRIVGRDDEGCLIFDLRTRAEQLRFSVVVTIDAHTDPLPLLRSLGSQDYPRERFEVIAVSTGSATDRDRVAAGLGGGGEIGLQYVEATGSSETAARNRGAALARNEFVVFLSGALEVGERWLTGFNAAFYETGAMVVAGRVDPTRRSESLPAWFSGSLPRHHMGLETIESTSSVFRIRHPFAHGGENIAYQLRLFQTFGGFPETGGSTGGMRRESSARVLNLRMLRGAVPIAYARDVVAVDRTIRTPAGPLGVLRAAYDRGVCDAIVNRHLLSRAELQSVADRLNAGYWARVARTLGGSRRFEVLTRRVYELGLMQHIDVVGRQRVVDAEPAARLSDADWLEIVRRMPSSVSRNLQLFHLLRRVHGHAGAVERLDDLLSHDERSAVRDLVELHPTEGSEGHARYAFIVEELERVVAQRIPLHATIAVVSKGDDELLRVGERTAWHFPRYPDGRYAGYYPSDGREALEHLEELIALGAEYFVLPEPSSWWLETYPELRQRLDAGGEVVFCEPEIGAIYRLTARRPLAARRAVAQLARPQIDFSSITLP